MKRAFFAINIILFLFFSNVQGQTITYTPVTGTINACEYFASSSPNLQQFNISGSNLIGDITIGAADGLFEISLSPGSGYSNMLTLTPTAGTVSSTTIYVRTAATDPSSPVPLSIRLSATSPQAPSQNILVSGTVRVSPTADPIKDVTYNSGDMTSPINFSGTAASYSWTNDTPSIGLAASGTGPVPSFVATNNGTTLVKAAIVVTPEPANPGECVGPPITFHISVNPTTNPVITATGALSNLNTIYGTPSTSTIFTVSAAGPALGIVVTAPAGFEVSTDGINFSSTLTIGAAAEVAATTVYVRLAATTHVGSNYTGPVTLTSGSTIDKSEIVPASVVNPAPLIVIADDKTKIFGDPLPVLTASYSGFVNGDGPAQLTTLATVTTIATASSAIGQYPIIASGAAGPDYTIDTYIPGTLTVIAAPSSLVIPNTFTPNGDGINDTWDIQFLNSYVNCTVNIFSRYGEKVFSSIGYGTPWDGTYRGSKLPLGPYYYVIDLKTGYKLLSGYITIIR